MTDTDKWPVGWSTRDELVFLDGLGMRLEQDRSLPRRQLLEGYRAGMARRRDWRHLDRVAIEEHLALLLRGVEANEKTRALRAKGDQ